MKSLDGASIGQICLQLGGNQTKSLRHETMSRAQPVLLACPLCVNEYSANEEAGRLPRRLPCLHVFCAMCLAASHNVCPETDCHEPFEAATVDLLPPCLDTLGAVLERDKSRSLALSAGVPIAVVSFDSADSPPPTPPPLPTPPPSPRPLEASKGPRLFDAAEHGDVKELQRLLGVSAPANWANPDSNAQTALMAASREGHAEAVTLLISACPATDVNRTDSAGYTALALACAHGRSEVVKILLAVPGIDVKRCNIQGATARQLALQHGHLDIAAMIAAPPGGSDSKSGCRLA